MQIRLSRALVAIVALLAVSFAPASAQVDVGCLQGAPLNVDGQIQVSGNGKQNTRPFELTGGAYTVRWSSNSTTQFGGNVILHLRRTDGVLGSELLVNTVVNREKPTASGETQVYNVKPGTHYLDVTSPGEWSVIIAPQ